ncbi:MAG: helix-turn-helix domain-containing protein [Desulfurococcaceae archaeon]
MIDLSSRKPPHYVLEAIAELIAGEAVLSDNPGDVVRKWRVFYGLSLTDLAKLMKVSSSTVSDYERGRRFPGRAYLKKFVNALFKHDEHRDWVITRNLSKQLGLYVEGIVDKGDFIREVSLDDFIQLTESIVLTPIVDQVYLRGYVIVDSVKSIESMTTGEHYRLLSMGFDRAVIFTNITRGRSVMVATRVSPLKPRLVVLHGVKNIDPLAIRISELENIPLLVTTLDLEETMSRLKKIKLA